MKKDVNTNRKLSKFLDGLSSFSFVLPYFLFFITFSLLPVILTIGISFLEWDMSEPAKFIGLKNFELIFRKGGYTAELFWNSVKHTLLFVVIESPILILLPLLIALLLNVKGLKGSKVMRALLYFPAILSVSTVATVFFVLLDTNIGIINVFSGKETPWLTDQPFQWISIFMMSTWWGIGGNMILFTAGLQNIPKELYEASSIDGCNKFRQFLSVTLPGLKQTMIYVIIMTIISSFNVMGQPMMLTSGEESTQVAMQYIYSVAFGGNKFGRACAMSLIMTAMMLVFSIIAFKLNTRESSGNNAN